MTVAFRWTAHVRRSWVATCFVVVLIVAGLPPGPALLQAALAGSPLYTDSFDDPAMIGWTTSGVIVRRDCALAVDAGGCSLNMSSQVQNEVVGAHRDVELDLDAPAYSVSFWFRAQKSDSTHRSPAWFELQLSDGNIARVNLTDGTGRNGLRLSNATTETAVFATHIARTWYQVKISMETGTKTLRAEMRSTSGVLYGRSTPVGLGPGATSIERIAFFGSFTGSAVTNPPVAMNFDAISIESASAPGAPVLGGLPGPGGGEITLTWTPPAEDGGAPIVNYSVYGGSLPGNHDLLANTSASARSYTDAGLGVASWRHYRITAWNAVGQGAYSSEVSLRTYDLPSPPEDLHAAAGPQVGTIVLHWQPPTSTGGDGATITNYRIHRGEDPSSLAMIDQVVGAASSYLDAHRRNGTLYYYAVRATNAAGTGPATNVSAALAHPDESGPVDPILIEPASAWTGEPRTIRATYRVAASECPPPESCPTEHEWRIYQGGSPTGPDGALVASGRNSHSGHAGVETFQAETVVPISGQDGPDILKLLANPRVGSTQWAESSAAFQIDAPAPARLIGPAQPQLDRETRTGNENVRVTSSYSVVQKICRASESCAVENQWRILLDGASPTSGDGSILAEGTNLHPAHGGEVRFDIDRSVFVPRLDPGPHYLKVAARPDNESAWKVTGTYTSGVLFQPPLQDEGYANAASARQFRVEQAHGDPIWALGPLADPTPGLDPGRTWATTLKGPYPGPAKASLVMSDLDLSGGDSALLSFETWFDLEDGVDTGAVWARDRENQALTLLHPTEGPLYGEEGLGWTGNSGGWRSAVFDLEPVLGRSVDILFTFESDARIHHRGWLIDDIRLTTDGASTTSSFELHWPHEGSWKLGRPTTGPGQGYSGPNAWAVAPDAPYLPGERSTLELPPIPLQGVKNATFSFRQWLRAEYPHDRAWVEVSADGGNWQILHPAGGPSYTDTFLGLRGWSGDHLGWRESVFDLTGYVGTTATLRFLFESDGTIESAGWYLSDFLVRTGRPQVDPPLYFNKFATGNDAFYAYFASPNTEASITTPDGHTTRLRYVGTQGDVVARLSADGEVKARRAVVVLNNPTPVPASQFVVDGPGFNGTYADASWTLRGAATPSGVGGVRLEVGGNALDDVLPGFEGIEATGLGRMSASNRPEIHWNRHHQTSARYDTSATSANSAVETLEDRRLRYLANTDADAFDDKAELAGFSDLEDAASDPTTDDDGDGVPNFLEGSRNNARDFFAREFSGLVAGDFAELDWEHLGAASTAGFGLSNWTGHDWDNDTLPDYADLANDPGEAREIVTNHPAGNILTILPAAGVAQLAIIVPPDWRTTLLVELGTTGGDHPLTEITYDEFFARLVEHYENSAFAVAGTDEALYKVLRTHLSADMKFLAYRTAATAEVVVPLVGLAGTPADGTWTAIHDIRIQALELNVANTTLTTQGLPHENLPPVGALFASWNFFHVHHTLRGFDGARHCVSYEIYLERRSCPDAPRVEHMREYTAGPGPRLPGLVSQLRQEYLHLALGLDVRRFVEAALDLGRANPPTSIAWSNQPTANFSASDARELVFRDAVVATGDWGGANPRNFDWTLVYSAPDPKGQNVAHLMIGVEPADGSHGPSDVLIRGSALAGLGVALDRTIQVIFDPEHQAGGASTTRDFDGDGLNDTLVRVPHFSKAWLAVSNSFPIHDLSLATSSRGIALTSEGDSCPWPGPCHRVPRYLMYDSTQFQAWRMYELPWSTGYRDWDAVAAHASTPAVSFILLRNPQCGQGGSATNYAVRYARLYYIEPNNIIVDGNPVGAHDACNMQPRDLYALNPERVWVLTDQGAFFFKRNDAHGYIEVQSYPDVRANAVFARDENEAYFLTDSNPSRILRYSGGTFTDIGSAGFGVEFADASHDRNAWWGGRYPAVEPRLGHWLWSCTCWTNDAMMTQTSDGRIFGGFRAFGHDGRDGWYSGLAGASGHLARSGSGESRDAHGDFSAGSILYGMDFVGKHDGWVGGLSGQLYHYGGANEPPTARGTLVTTAANTAQDVQAHAEQSTDPDADPLAYSWTWGTGGESSGKYASHRYRAPGTYTITLRAVDTDDAWDDDAFQVNVDYADLVDGQPLTLNFTASQQKDYYRFHVPPGRDLLRLTLSGPTGANFDLYVKSGSAPTLTSYTAAGQEPSSSETVSISNPGSGPWYVLVHSVNGVGDYTLTAVTRTRPTVPSVVANPQPVASGQSLTLTGSSTSTTSGAALHYTINWGDGTPEMRAPATGSLASGAAFWASHTYAAPGDYTAQIRVTDQDGLTNTRSSTVVVRDPPSGITQPAQAVLPASATLVGNIGALGGYASVQAWFDYGPTPALGTWTPANTRTTGTFTTAIGGLAPNTKYYYRILLQNPMGTTYGAILDFTTVNIPPGAPTIADSLDYSARYETFHVGGTASDPEGHRLHVEIDWGDGTTSRDPVSGTAGSPYVYSMPHAYSSFGSYTIRARAVDEFGTASPWSSLVHGVVDWPAAAALPATNVGRQTALLHGTVNNFGGDPDTKARFEYGLRGGPLDQVSPWLNAAEAMSYLATNLIEGANYDYRLLAENRRGASGSGVLSFRTNTRPSLDVIAPFDLRSTSGDVESFLVVYKDVDNDPPITGVPILTIGSTSSVPLAKLNPNDHDYTDGVSYVHETPLAAGTYRNTRVTFGDALGSYDATIGDLVVKPRTIFHDPIHHQSNAPMPAGWDRTSNCPSSSLTVNWHTIQTPAVPGLADAPDWPHTPGMPPSVSLWFGDNNTGTYANGNQRTCGSALTPTLLLDGASPALSFWSYFETEDNRTTHDTKKIYLVRPGHPDVLLAQLTDHRHGLRKWWPVHIPLHAYAGQEVRIRFEFDSVNGINNEHRGWFVNEVTLGADLDWDAIPDVEEDRTVQGVVWKAKRATSNVPAGSSGKAIVSGPAFTAMRFAHSLIQLPADPAGITLRINTPNFSTTVLSASGLLSPWTRVLFANSTTTILATDLLAAGMSQTAAFNGEDLTLTLVNSRGTPVAMPHMYLSLGGTTRADIGDSDGDGISDGEEGMLLGTSPLTRDPDNDGFFDGIDERPWSADDPPSVTVQRLPQGWERGVFVNVTSRHGVRDVVVHTTNGSERRLNTTEHRVNPDNESWRFDFVGAASTPSSIRIDVTDQFGNTYRGTLAMTVSTGKLIPAQRRDEFLRLGPDGSSQLAAAPLVGVVPCTVGAAVCVAAGVAVVIIAGVLVVERTTTPEDPSVHEVVRSYDWLTPTALAYSFAYTSPFGCSARIGITSGPSASPYVRRGISGIQKMHPGTPIAQPILDLQYDIEHGAVPVKFDEHRAAYFYYNNSTDTLTRWDLSTGHGGCDGSAYDEAVRKHSWKVPDQLRRHVRGALYGSAGLLAIYAGAWISHVTFQIHESEVPPVLHHVHVYDMSPGWLAPVRTLVAPTMPGWWEGIVYGTWVLTEPLAQPLVDPLWFGYVLGVMESEIGPKPPVWFWHNSSKPNFRAGSLARLPTLAADGIISIDDENSSRNAWNDVATMTTGDFRDTIHGKGAIVSLMRRSADEMTDWAASHPPSGHWAYIAAAGWAQPADRISMVALAQHPNQLKAISRTSP